MIAVLGGIGLGLVWGWLAVRLLAGARRAMAVRVPLWLALQALLVAYLGAPGALAGFAAGLAAGVLLARAWRSALEWRAGLR
ncbi:hypothetical protein [Kouleothrix sp.]|uniref:hypothetical protein n=1 Tax=Kouleothrix sp. TaxID=2779161 RepID=UPI003919BC43